MKIGAPRDNPYLSCAKYTFSTWPTYRILVEPSTGSTYPVLASLVFNTQQCLKK